MSPKRKENLSIGERLRMRREEFGLSAAELAEEIQAPLRYVEALEGDRYEIFSAKVYAVGFLKKVLLSLAVDDAVSYIHELGNEWDVRTFRAKKELTPIPQNGIQNAWITPQRLALGIGGLFLILFLSFFGMRFSRFLGTPEMVVVEPADEAAFEEPIIKVKGNTEKESRLTVNGREITIDEAGNFEENLELAAGLHVLEFVSENRFGKTSKEVRRVIIK